MNKTIQTKLALDEGLEQTWNFLQKEFPALDKSSIIRLALNNLAKETKRTNSVNQVANIINESKSEYNSDKITEEEVGEWWNKMKKDLRHENNS